VGLITLSKEPVFEFSISPIISIWDEDDWEGVDREGNPLARVEEG
jgi:hypothetical protein